MWCDVLCWAVPSEEGPLIDLLRFIYTGAFPFPFASPACNCEEVGHGTSRCEVTRESPVAIRDFGFVTACEHAGK